MTERHEIMHCVECIDDALSIARYEVRAQPGHGPKFREMLSTAIENLEKAKELLKVVTTEL